MSDGRRQAMEALSASSPVNQIRGSSAEMFADPYATGTPTQAPAPIARPQRKRPNFKATIMQKLIDSIAYGHGRPGEGILPKSVTGYDLPANEQGMPPQGVDRAKFMLSLSPREKRFIQRMLKKGKSF